MYIPDIFLIDKICLIYSVHNIHLMVTLSVKVLNHHLIPEAIDTGKIKIHLNHDYNRM